MVEVSIPFAPPPGSPDNPVAFINNIELFTALQDEQTFYAPDNALELTFNVNIDPAVFMTKFNFSTNAATVDVNVQLEDVDTFLNLTVIFPKLTHALYNFYVVLNESNSFQKKMFSKRKRCSIL